MFVKEIITSTTAFWAGSLVLDVQFEFYFSLLTVPDRPKGHHI